MMPRLKWCNTWRGRKNRLQLIVQYSLIIKQAHPRLAGDNLHFKSQWQAFRGNGKKLKLCQL